MKPYQLDDRFRIDHDGTSFVLSERGKQKKDDRKSDGWSIVGYFPTLVPLFWSYITRSVGKGPGNLPDELTSAVAAVRKATDELSGAIKRACGGTL